MSEAVREIINYEYWIYSTPRFIGEPVSEFWEVHKVFHSWLDNGLHNFIVVLRRPFPAHPNQDSKVKDD
jgi:hypothetical protein